MKKLVLVIVIFIFGIAGIHAQKNESLTPVQAGWPELMLNRDVNFYDVQKEFLRWKAERALDAKTNAADEDEDEDEDGSELYYRWENLMEPRVYPTGVRPSPLQSYLATEEYRRLIGGDKFHTTGNWSPLGPVDYNGLNPSDGIGMGRVNGSAVDLNDTNNIYLATPAGGIWNSKDGGSSWITTTDNLSTLSFQHVAIDPNNSNIIYAASGDGETTIISPHGTGVFKSTDAGATWNITGLNWENVTTNHCHKIIVDNTNSNIVIVASDAGTFRSTDAGATWVKTFSGNFYDIKFNTTDHAIIYGVTPSQFYRSVDNGQSFTLSYSVPTSMRITLGVTPANSDYIYLVSAKTVSYGFNGLYRSTDGGSVFTLMSDTPNVLGNKFDGSGTGLQGWYDLTLAVSPVDPDLIFVGGINIWKSMNGGSTWSIVTFSNHKTVAPYVHVDFHSLDFYNGVLYACSDGGFYKTNDLGATWTDLSGGLQIAQFYHIGGHPTMPNLIYAGAQDNGVDKYTGSGTWSHVYGKDGFRALIDYTNSNVVYTTSQNGSLYRSTDDGTTFDSLATGITGAGAWDTPFIMDPLSSSTLYAGYKDLWKSVDSGSTWTKISNINFSTSMNFIAIAPSDPNYIYIGFTNALYATTDGGANWTYIMSGLPNIAPTSACVSPTDPLKVWVTFSGYGSASKVYASVNGGNTWKNYSGYLPNIPVNGIVYEKGSKDGLYIGLDQGVYYRDSTSANWQPFMNGLPNVMVRDFEINYTNNKIRASTFGRGVWESDLFTGSTPVAVLASDKFEICAGDSIKFTDISFNNPDNRSWSFGGGSPSVSTSAQQTVVYSSAGTYSVTLTVSNSFGTDSITKTAYVVVTPDPVAAPYSEGFESISFPDHAWVAHDVVGGSKWELTSAASHSGSKAVVLNNYNGNPPDDDYFVTPSFNLKGVTSASLTFYVAFAEKISTSDNVLTVSASNNCGVSWISRLIKFGSALSTTGGSLVSGDFIPQSSEWRQETVNLNSSLFSGKPNLKIKFAFTNKTGNNIYIDDINLTGVTGVDELNEAAGFTISPNPFNDLVSIVSNSDPGKNVEIGIFNVMGERVISEKFDHPSGNPMVMNMSRFSAGVYFIKAGSGDRIETHKIIKISN